MSRPEVDVENYKALYEFYTDYRPNKAAAWLLHGAMRIGFAPKVVFAPGAEDDINALHDQGRTFGLAANHTLWKDPCDIAAMALSARVFLPLIGNTFIPTKPSISKHSVVRYLVDPLGQVPVFRSQDVSEEPVMPQDGSPLEHLPVFQPEDIAEEANRFSIRPQQSRVARGATLAFMKTCVFRLDDGQYMSIFPEGTRNTEDPLTVQDLKGGLGSMLCRVSKVTQPAVVPVGIFHGEYALYGRTSTMYIGRPSVVPFKKPGEVKEWLAPELQAAVDGAALAAAA